MIKYRMIKENKKEGKSKVYNRIKTMDSNLDVLVEHLSSPTATHDSYSNVAARLGVGTDNILNYSSYTSDRITNFYPLLTSLYRDNWVIRNIISAIPNDITRKWFDIKCSLPPKEMDKVERLNRRTNLVQEVNRGMQWGRLYGGAVGIILIRGQEDNLDEPLNYDYILPDSFCGLYIVDRWAGVTPSLELIDDITSPDFGLPMFYDITDMNINMRVRVHHSKIIRFIGRELPNVERIRELYWGVSEVEALYRDLIRRDATAENISSLVFKANLSVVKMKDLDQMFTINSVAVQNRFWRLMENISSVESNLGVKVVNADDSVDYLNYGFNGLREIYETMMMDLSGASRIPVTKLFGRSPAGMNSTGESDLQNYYEFLEDIRESQFKKVVLKLLPIIALSCWGHVPEDLDFEFGSFKELDDLQKAQVIQQRAGTIIETFNANLIPQDVAQKELKDLSEQFGVFNYITDDLIKSCEGKFAADLQGMDDAMGGMGGMEDMMSGEPMGASEEVKDPEPQDPSASKDGLEDNLTDEVEKSLLSIRQNLLRGQEEGYFTADDLEFFDGDNLTLDDLFIQHGQLEKMKKKAERDYQEALGYMYSFNSMSDVPLDKVNKYNICRNKYNNISQHLSKLEEKIKAQGGAGRLMKVTGKWDEVLEAVDKEKTEIIKRFEDLEEKKRIEAQQQIVNPAVVNQGALV